MDQSDPESRKPASGPADHAGAGRSQQETRAAHGFSRPPAGSHGSSEERAQAESRYPKKLGRFSIKRCLGVGSFGDVLLAHDGELDRFVALKFPRWDRLAPHADSDSYVREARNAARLKHPGIVSVYDVNTEGDHVFIVMEYVQGLDLAEVLRLERLSPLRAAEVMIEIADAVSYAHEQGLVHRDLKPGNIILDCEGHPHVADFGLAVHEKGQHLLRGQVAGTPYYMSPEQVRGETHRLDGRTDVWSLGVVLYEILVGQRPFSGKTSREVFDEIEHREAKPLRQLDRKIPEPLERICLKCLSKRMTDRYPSASDLVDELCHWREDVLSASGASAQAPTATAPSVGALEASQSSIAEAKKPPVRVIPKGLRSFDADDADFFLELLPGPLDREGLPESIRFWKTRIEQTDPDRTFAVGLLYGPSGCGKSSLVKAGLLPRLADHVRAVYVEATGRGTEARLMRGLRRACRGLPEGDSLVGPILALREGQLLPRGEKVVIVLDQFEQWLHAWGGDPLADLVRALRHGDGQSVQCLLLVRDGFSMSAMRFMNAVEVPVIEGQNYATVDRFAPEHAREVLAHFGRAFGRLPEDGSLTSEQERFLEQAVEGLSEDGQVVPVRLALFADMVRAKPWDPASLRRVGGAEGIGMVFLEETLGASATNPTYRVHQRAARRVLDALLPGHGMNIRGHMLSRRELLEVSGYARRAGDFDELLRILDTELRLITPTDPQPETAEEEISDVQGASNSTESHYQLTHDYIVSSLRKWLARKQQETMRGRASLLLTSQAELWHARPERRYLPSFLEWATISLLTHRSERTDQQRKMMRLSTRLHSIRLFLAALLVAVALVAGLAVKSQLDRQGQQRAGLVDSLVSELLVAEWDRVSEISEQLKPYRELWHDQLVRTAKDSSRPPEQRVRAHLALASGDRGSIRPLVGRLLAPDVDGSEYRVLFRVLSQYPDDLKKWADRERESAQSASGGSQAEIERRAARMANACIALTRLGESDVLWPLLDSSEDPRLRTLLVHRAGPYGMDANTLLDRLGVENNPSIRQAVLLTLEACGSDGLAPGDRGKLIEQCLSLYESDPDPGVHSAAEWLLTRWGQRQKLEALRAKLVDGSVGDWYVNGQLQTMIVVRGPPDVDAEGDERRALPAAQIDHAFALSAHEVTIEQFCRFRPGVEYSEDVSPSPQCPMNKVTWLEAARYCRWLSEQEHVPEEQMCYPLAKDIELGMTLPDDFPSRVGYRLPTEAEWEFACRAGALTSWFYGETEEMLGEYAWYDMNSEAHLWQVGRLKPNPFGFFDIYGNVMEWCHQPIAGRRASDGAFVARGGAYRYRARDAATTARHPFTHEDYTSFLGFRIARTIRD
ncbi:MAG TPA: protein kinase [Thermoguttaceae bacterium]|nr:protein kinase [Thermoguttaceae bacterium]